MNRESEYRSAYEAKKAGRLVKDRGCVLGKTHPFVQADLSHLGRNYLQMGMYTEIVFPLIFTSFNDEIICIKP